MMLWIRRISIASVAVLALAGCASWKEQKSKLAPVSEARQARHEAAVRSFEEQRDRAQLEAALDRWKQGDIAGCEMRLRTILARRPDDINAHMHLAELAWSCDNAAEAETEYRAALHLAPDRADVHHALALVLDTTGRRTEAAPLFARAAELEPEYELFRQ